MLSEHLRKFDELPYKTLLMVAAGLVILCQLAAMAFVADAQVAKAKLRDNQRRAELAAIAHCMESRAGAERNSCIQQARVMAAAPPQPSSEASTKAPVFAEASASSGGAMPARPSKPASPPQGFMAASFSIR